MERLKAHKSSKLPMSIRHLHSSMERLKAGEQIPGASLQEFTFQYGEIKRVDCRKNGLLCENTAKWKAAFLRLLAASARMASTLSPKRDTKALNGLGTERLPRPIKL